MLAEIASPLTKINVMKIQLLLYFLCASLTCFSQNINYHIKGTASNSNGSHVYLVSQLKQPDRNDLDVFQSCKIQDGKFEFKGQYNLNGQLLPQGAIFVDTRSDLSKQEVISKFKNFVWVPDQTDHLRSLQLEDMEIVIDTPAQARTAQIVRGGELTKQMDEVNQAVRSRNRRLLHVIKRYPNSPACMSAIEFFTAHAPKERADKTRANVGAPNEMFELLSEDVKKSEWGVKWKKKIDELMESWK